MSKKRKRLRKNKEGLFNPRKVLDDGHWMPISFSEKVFVALTWLGFTNAEAWGVINPLSEASPNSKAVMAGRMACSHSVKAYIEVLNRHQSEKMLTFKGFKDTRLIMTKKQNKNIATMENTTELDVRFYAPKTNTNPCYTPLRFAVSYKCKRLYCTINIPALDAKELDKIDTDCTLKQGYRQAPEAGVADTLQKIRDIIQSIAEEAIKLGEWDDFTSADLKGIVGCLFYWICDPNVISPKDSAAGLCWQWICHKKGIKL